MLYIYFNAYVVYSASSVTMYRYEHEGCHLVNTSLVLYNMQVRLNDIDVVLEQILKLPSTQSWERNGRSGMVGDFYRALCVAGTEKLWLHRVRGIRSRARTDVSRVHGFVAGLVLGLRICRGYSHSALFGSSHQHAPTEPEPDNYNRKDH